MLGRLGTIVLLVVWVWQVAGVAPMEGTGAGGPRTALGRSTLPTGNSAAGHTAWTQVEDWCALVVYQAQRLTPGQGRGTRRGGGGRIRRIRRRRRQDRRRPVIARRALKPVLDELVWEEAVRQTSTSVESEARADGLSGFRLPVQIVVVTPDYSQTVCPQCGGPTKCKRSYYIHPQDIDLGRPTVLQVYREVRECRAPACEGRLAPALDFVEKRGRFTQRAKQKAIASVTEDGMPLERVPQRMWRDFHVRVAKSTVYEWVHAEAETDLGEAEYTHMGGSALQRGGGP